MNLNQQSVYAFKNECITHISEVSRGLSCGCICIKCGKKLIAKKGPIKIDHFAHQPESNCQGAAETLLHMLAKELVSELEMIKLPEYLFSKTRKLKNGLQIRHEQKIAKGGDAKITQVFVEQKLNTVRPDIIIESGNKNLIIEIAVTHKVDKYKLRQIRQIGTPALEIRLNLADALLTREELKEKLRNHNESKCWLFHPEQIEAEKVYINKVRQAIRNKKKLQKQLYQSKSLTKPSVKYSNFSSYFSNAKIDRMAYEFFCRNNRQPTEEEYSRLHTILYGKKSTQ